MDKSLSQGEEGFEGGKMSNQEKAIMTRRTPREELGCHMFISPTPYEFMRSLKHSDVCKIGRGKHKLKEGK